MNTKTSLCVAMLLFLSATAATAASTELYGVEFPGSTPLFRIDQTTGAVATVGNTGTDNLGDLTSDTRAGSERIWGVRIASNELMTIDPATGAVTGAVPLSFAGGAPAIPGGMTSLAFNPVSGRLYGNTSVGFGAPQDALYDIDPLTGVSTFVGNIATPAGPLTNIFALGFSQAGRLYGVSDSTDQLLAIDHNTGASNVIATLQVSLAFDIASRPSDDVMFLADSGTSRLWTLDTTTGTVFDVGPYVAPVNVVGLAFAPVPEPTTVLLFAMSLPALGYVARRCRRIAAK